MALILRDFECGWKECGKIFEELVPVDDCITLCPTCESIANKILTFHGIIKINGESSLPPILARDSGLTREVSPGRDLTPHFEEEREHSNVRWVEKKLPDGRTVRRPSIKIDEPKSRGLNSNLELDVKRDALKRRS